MDLKESNVTSRAEALPPPATGQGLLGCTLHWNSLTRMCVNYKSLNKTLVVLMTLFLVLTVCACPVTSLRACGGELTNLLMEHCGEAKRLDEPAIKRMTSYGGGESAINRVTSYGDGESAMKRVAPSYGGEDLSTESEEENEAIQTALLLKIQALLGEWRRRHEYDVNVSALRVRRRRRAVSLSGFLDQCCQTGCRLSDLVSVGFC